MARRLRRGTGPPPYVAVFTAEIEQGLAVVDFGFNHFSDKNGVIAGKMRSRDFATQLEKRAFQYGNSAGSPAIMNGQALLGLGTRHAFREVFGHGFVTFLQHADAELFFLFQHGKNCRALFDTDQNQQGIERNRSEGIGGHPAHGAGSALDGYNGDACGEMSESFSQLMRGESWRFHVLSILY